MKTLFLDFDGIGIGITNHFSDQNEVLELMRFCFAPFVVEIIHNPEIIFEIGECIPEDFNGLLPVPAFGPLRVFGWWNKRKVHYAASSIAATMETGNTRRYWFTSKNSDILNEMVYLAILSSVGERYDLKGMHRIHGMGIECQNRCSLIVASSGTGKSALTLLLSRLSSEVRFFSDESPLLTRSSAGATMHPFPTRIALQTQVAAALSISGHSQFRRINYPEKQLITFPRIARKGTLGTLIFARQNSKDRTLQPSIVKTGRFDASIELFSPLVIGVGLAQMAIWMLRLSAFPRLAKILFSRFRLYVHLIWAIPEIYVMHTNFDARKNAKALAEFFGIKSKTSVENDAPFQEVNF